MLATVLGHPALAGVTSVLDERVSAVGGIVRDALLERPSGPDVDLVVEGDPRPLAQAIARATGGDLEVHPRFRTVSVVLGDGERLDLVGARRETYPSPGALPEVAPGTLLDDLARRDFTANAMALRLVGPGAGEVVDPHGGRADLAEGVLRLMRLDGFREDPSRLVRAARYVSRIGLRLDPGTAAAAHAAAPSLDPASARVVDELLRLLAEEDPARASTLLAEWGAPWLRAELAEARGEVAALERARDEPGAPAVSALALRLGALVAPDALGRLALPGPLARGARAMRRGTECAAALDAARTPSAVDAVLARAPDETAVAALAAGADVVVRWWSEWRDLRPAIDGNDLVDAGVPRGPVVGRALEAVRTALLDGESLDRVAQLALAMRVAAEGMGR